MNRKNDDRNSNDNDCEDDARHECSTFEVFNANDKVANYLNVRATDLPTVQRLFPPKTGTIQQELAMQNTREKMMRVITEFKRKRCNNKGWLKKSNVSKEQLEGLKERKDKVNTGEMVVYATDKTNKLTADSMTNEGDALDKHTKDDKKKTNESDKKKEREMNQHLS